MKHIIFDCSDTLLRLGSIDFLEELTGNREQAEDIHYRLFRSPAWYEYDCGRIKKEELEQHLLPLLDKSEQEIGKKYLQDWMEHYTVIPGIPELLAELKEKGYKLYLLSDYPPCFEELWNRFDLFGYFDGRVISYEEGLRKSDGGLFDILLEKYDLAPQDCFFADDLPANIETAQKAGIRGHVFTTVEDLRKALGLS